MTLSIGFIGLGVMGLPMASNLVRKGFAVTAYDIDKDRIAALSSLGASAAESAPSAVRKADIVITMLPATQHVEQVVLGPNGILAAMRTEAVLIDMSTIDSKGTDRVAAACADRSIAFADCPVGRLALHAERGESLFMVGAEDVVFARIEPVLRAMGTTIHRCGAPGMGSRMKLVNNFMLLSTAQIVAEAVMLGTKLNLPIETIVNVTKGTTAHNGQLHSLFLAKVLQGDIEPGFTIDLAFKDLGLAIAAAGELRVGLPAGSAVYAVYGGARSGEYSNKDYSSLLTLACKQAGVDTPKLPKQC
jgi:4-hydroxybutyrate dehydrogenase/sulfolactaldehyde 3-reductase